MQESGTIFQYRYLSIDFFKYRLYRYNTGIQTLKENWPKTQKRRTSRVGSLLVAGHKLGKNNKNRFLMRQYRTQNVFHHLSHSIHPKNKC
jgi:hypothetical protein